MAVSPAMGLYLGTDWGDEGLWLSIGPVNSTEAGEDGQGTDAPVISCEELLDPRNFVLSGNSFLNSDEVG